MQEKLLLLHQFMIEASAAKTEDELKRIYESYRKMLIVDEDDAVILKLLQDTLQLGSEMLIMKAGGADSSMNRKIAALSEEERAELAEVEKIIDENRFAYHFQPIVNTTDGTIYSYEALMRPVSDMRLSPFHVLKYAELKGRLHDIEYATFLNVLTCIDQEKDRFLGRKIFINSIPRMMLTGSDFRRVGELLMKHSDTAVVELTEYAESDEEELNVLKERYRNMGVKIAIDDYGTGYSNVNNLLRYMPDYVKIDRSLISDIQNNPKKRHFVREIIEFCHGNGIMALAEGVETTEELRNVILLGADLIQGYYTAKPSAQIIDAIPYEIQQEIRIYQQERQDGRDQQVYFAEARDRILLDKIARDGYKCIYIGKNESDDNKVTIIGLPSLDTEIHLEVAPNYIGKIVLENAHLSNVKNRPCINLSGHSDVTLQINGENKLDKSGIRVPEGTKLTIEGDGLLDISVDAAEYFAIGNDLSSGHGDLIFQQSGLITINGRGRRGICIGSGMGGNIELRKGKCMLHISGYNGVGIGSFYSDSKLDISNCAVDADMSLRKGVAIGSMTGSTEVRITQSSVQLNLSGEEWACIGTIGGDNASVLIQDAITTVTIRALLCTCLGSLEETTSCKIDNATFRATACGDRSLPFGSLSGDTKILLLNSDTSVSMDTSVEIDKYLSVDNISVSGGRTSFSNHGKALMLAASASM